MSQCVAVCCSVLQCQHPYCLLVCCSEFLRVAESSCVLQCATVCCSEFLCVAVCQSVLLCCQCVASKNPAHQCRIRVQISPLLAGVLQRVAVCCSVLQCVAVYCSMLQCVAVCCSALHSHLQHTNIARRCQHHPYLLVIISQIQHYSQFTWYV